MVDFNHLKIFGSMVYTLIPKKKSIKLNPTSKECSFFQYVTVVKGYRLWYTVDFKVIVSKNIFSMSVDREFLIFPY